MHITCTFKNYKITVHNDFNPPSPLLNEAYSYTYFCTIMCFSELYFAAPSCTELYNTVLYFTKLYYTVQYCTVLYCIELYRTVLYWTVLYSIVLYCTGL